MKILIVDDNKEITDTLEIYFNQEHDITCFNDSLEAWHHFEINHDYDLVITDFLMPQLRGDALVEKMYEVKPEQHFIVISGYFTKGYLDILKKSSGFKQMIDKPIDMEELRGILNSVEMLC